MDTLNPLSPNTAAFLDSIAFDVNDTSQTSQTSFPPSTFFPVPGRDTPEESSPDSVGKPQPSLSDDSEPDMPGMANGASAAASSHKRKAQEQHHNPVIDDLDDEDLSNSDNGHEDKRQHNEKRGSSRRKSSGSKEDIKPKTGGTKDNMTKAQRRKEQNRAAQKAFRERREAKVRDLEAKVAELEAKSFGATVENENLRNILKRLQEENVALKQAAFTFTMPVNGTPTSGRPTGGQQTPTAAAPMNPSPNPPGSGIDWSQFTSFRAQPQVTKPPSPPQSVSNDSLRSIHDISPNLVPHRGSNGSLNDSPESLVSINSLSPSSGSDRNGNGVPSLFGTPGASNLQPPQVRRSNSNNSPADNLSTPSSIGGTNKDDVEALFRSLYPNGIDAVLAGANSGATNVLNQGQQPYTFLAQPGLTSLADSSSNSLAQMFGGATSYRDPTATAQAPSNAPNNNNLQGMSFGDMSATSLPAPTPAAASGSLANQAAWADLTDNSVNDFLASLTGSNNNDDMISPQDDDAFSRQLEALIAQSGGTAAPFANNNTVPANNSAFSPTNYLNMSPSPLQSMSSSQTPRSATESSTSPTSPVSSVANGTPESCAPCNSNVVHVVGDDGRVMRPSELWTKMGMQNANDGDLLIDDLCSQMKSKATCKDGRRYMNYNDVEGMVKLRTAHGDWPPSRSNSNSNGSDCPKSPAKPEPTVQEQIIAAGLSKDMAENVPSECRNGGNPEACQAKMNEAFLKQNGVTDTV